MPAPVRYHPPAFPVFAVTEQIAMPQSGTLSILLVSDTRDESLVKAVEQFRAAGLTVEISPNVYAAMAKLALGGRFRRVLVDVRSLDRHEMTFLQLVPRYFNDTIIEVPALPGAARALVHLGQQALKTIEVAALIEHLTSTRPTPPPMESTVEPAEVAQPPPSTGPLSTDGIAEQTDSGPSLHEAVRQRMSGDAEGAPTRQPPRRTPPRPPPPAAPVPTSADVSPAKLRTFLDGGSTADPTANEPIPGFHPDAPGGPPP